MYTQQQNLNPNSDTPLCVQPDETASALAWHPKSNYLACSSWDGKVLNEGDQVETPFKAVAPNPNWKSLVFLIRCWQINENGSSELKGMVQHEAPALDLAWDPDGSKIYSAGCDNKGMMWDVSNNSFTQIAQHEQPIKVCRVVTVPNGPLVCTGSWDKNLSYWDTRQKRLVAANTLSDRISCADFIDNLAVICTADNKIYIYDLSNPMQLFKGMDTPLKYQTRCVSCFPNKTGFAVGSIEGRIAIHYIDDSTDQQGKSKDFSFKCHRENDLVYSINVIRFHPEYGTFLSGGSDRCMNVWDKELRSRVREYKKVISPITAAALNCNGSILAYAQGYDWHKGVEHYNPTTYPTAILLRPVTTDMKKK